MPVDLSANDVVQLFPDVAVDGEAREGGQKLVFPVLYEGSRLALKFIDAGSIPREPGSQAEADAGLERARREVLVLGKASSPHLVRCGAIQPTLKVAPRHGSRQLFCYSEEWIDGDDLRQILTPGGTPRSLGPHEVVKLGLDILDALSALERIKIVHRDIKPDNIIRKHSSHDSVLIDLGICYDMNGPSLTATTASSPVTPGYASPEQLNHGTNHKIPLDGRSDLFCLGIVLYEALYGLHPFRKRGDSWEQWYRRILQDPPLSPSKSPSRDSPAATLLSSFLTKLLAKYPYLRFPTCGTAREVLLSIEGGDSD